MILKTIILLYITSTSAAPIQLKYLQPMQSFQMPQGFPLDIDGMNDVEGNEERTRPETSQPLFWPQFPFEMSEQRLLKQDQVQHQMFTTQHTSMNKKIQLLKPESSEMPLDMQPDMPLLLQPEMSLANQAMMQQQILALHRLQALHKLNTMNMAWFSPRPLLIFLPMQAIKDTEDNNEKGSYDETKSDINAEHKTDHAFEDTDPESVITDAANSDDEKTRINSIPMLVTPYARFSLGDLISGIPWLPIEINVPDTVAWAYNGISNGISGIISIIGQWPSSRPSSKTVFQGSNTKVFLKQMMKQDPMPVIIMAHIAQLPML